METDKQCCAITSLIEILKEFGYEEALRMVKECELYVLENDITFPKK